MSNYKRSVFLVWKVYQRRAESLAYYFDMPIIYCHYAWEERSKVHKMLSYLFKSAVTMFYLMRNRPTVIFIQLPPTPALYITAVYGILTGTPYIADCHNAMFMGWWARWPLVKTFMRRAAVVLVHNHEVCREAEKIGVRAIVLRDPLPQPKQIKDSDLLQRLGLVQNNYVIAPWNLASDEPMAEFIDAVRRTPDVKFVMTWFTERLPDELRTDLPDNLIFTGYLEIDEFNELFSKSGAAISLTIRPGTQPSAASEAIAFGVPLILSDMETARSLYREVPVFVDNDPPSISAGVQEIMANQDHYRKKVLGFREELRREIEREIEQLKARLA